MHFIVGFTKLSRKEYDKLVEKNPAIQKTIARLLDALSNDPYNLTRRFDIKKLTDVNVGKWRIRSGNYRIRYDIDKEKVVVNGVFNRKKGY